MIKLALTGLVAFSPLKKRSMLMPTPVKPQKAMRGRSFRSTFSGRTSNSKPNRTSAPVTRSTMNPLGPTRSGIRPLATR